MNFGNPRFLRAAWTLGDAGRTAVAFAGRSNAGKSSVLNALCGGRFARAAKTPGRTRMINLFALADGHILADLPGYGYAAVSRSEQQIWGGHIVKFLRAPQIAATVLVADCRRGIGDKDNALLAIVSEMPTLVLMNKIDKLSRAAAKECLAAARAHLAKCAPGAQVLPFSALKKSGAEEARQVIAGFFGES